MPRIIEVIDYDAAWPQQYEAEAARLRPVFGAALAQIHHVGSTSVAGMRAKPTIDILGEIAPDVPIEEFYPGMSELGYDCRGECLDAAIPGTPGRHYFSRKVDAQHTHHVHVCHTGHHQISELLALRDYLRQHPGSAAEYGNLKGELARRFSLNNIEYMRGKDRFVKGLAAKAVAWKNATAPSER